MEEDNQEMEFFKEKLFSNFKEAGLLDHLKSQMRYNILEKLQKKNLAKDNDKENRNTMNNSKENALSNRILISIVAEYLESHGFNYTQAVFLPEAKHTNQTLTKREIVEILHLDKIMSGDESTPLLNKIVKYVELQLDHTKERMNVQCQTDFEGRNVNLEDKLKNIDFEYFQKIDGERLNTQQSFEEKFQRMKRDYDQRMKAELAAEITRIREFELANIRLDEAEKYRVKSEQYREELDRVYTEKLQKLRERERDTIERCKHQLKNLEVASYEYRQKFLKDHEIHKMKEEELDRHLKNEKTMLKNQHERLQEMEREYQMKYKELEEQKTITLRKTEALKTMNQSRFETFVEAEEDRLQTVQLKNRLETEILKSEQLKHAIETSENQNKRLLDENRQVSDEIRRLREAKRDLEVELDKAKESLQVLKSSLEKDEAHIKLYDKQIQNYQDEVSQLKAAVQEYKNIVQDRKREQVEANQKFIKEIEFYQSEIEKLERERDILKRRLSEAEEQQQEQAPLPAHISHLSVRTATKPIPTQENILRTSHGLQASSHRFQTSYGVEEAEDPYKKLEALEDELRELRNFREQQVHGVQNRSGRKEGGTKAFSSSPRFEKDRYNQRIDTYEFSPQFKTLPRDNEELADLQRQKNDLKKELKQMIGLDESKQSMRRFDEESFSELKKSGVKDKFNFDQIFDKYTDKMLRESEQFNDTKELQSAGKLKYEDFAPSGTKKIQAHEQTSSHARDIFKVDSPVKKVTETKVNKRNDFEEISQKSNRSFADSFTEDPKPIIFTNKDSKKQAPKEEAKVLPEKKKEVKEEIPYSLGNKNLSRLDKPSPKEGTSTKAPTQTTGITGTTGTAGKSSSSPLTLPAMTGKSSSPLTLPSLKKDDKKPQRNNAAIDSILGTQKKTTDELDFEEFEEEFLDE